MIRTLLTNISVIKDLLARHGFHFSKTLGQNFLVNPSVCPRIASLGGAAPGVGVLEIGPGIGTLTSVLAQTAQKVVAIEVDRTLEPILNETLAEYPNASVLFGDVLEIDLHALLEREFPGLPVVVCANLPYYITTPILMRLFESRLPVEAVTVMVQKEAGTRLCAPLPSREAGAVTAAVRYYTQPQILFGVSAGSFLPAPKVDSCVVRFDVLRQPPVHISAQLEPLFFRLIRAGFEQRRKTLLNAVSGILSLPKETVAAAIAACGLSPSCRAEQLGLEQFAALARLLAPTPKKKEGEKDEERG